MDNQNIFFTRLDETWFSGEDVVALARSLLGKYLLTDFPEGRTVGRIVETEAYRGPDDRACHAWNNRCTARTQVMFETGGTAYIYLCYGIHHLFNVVTGPKGTPHAVLIRAMEPVENITLMLHRRKMDKIAPRLSAGPGTMSQALGLSTFFNGQQLCAPDSKIWIETREPELPEEAIGSGPRIGVSYAGTCALRPWRFWIKESPWVSGVKTRKNKS